MALIQQLLNKNTASSTNTQAQGTSSIIISLLSSNNLQGSSTGSNNLLGSNSWIQQLLNKNKDSSANKALSMTNLASLLGSNTGSQSSILNSLIGNNGGVDTLNNILPLSCRP